MEFPEGARVFGAEPRGMVAGAWKAAAGFERIFRLSGLCNEGDSALLRAVNTVVQAPEGAVPCTISEVVAALKSQKIEARHQKKDWGDWIILRGTETVISVESMRGLTSTGTIEHCENEPDGLALALQAAFHQLGWEGVDEDGPYPLG